jgi:phytanoyl-CoA hydroxylase
VVTVEELRQWRDAGYLLLRGVVPKERLAAVQRRFEEVVDDILETLHRDGKIADTRPGLPFERRLTEAAGSFAGRYGRSWRKQFAGRGVFDLQCDPGLVNVVANLTEADVIGHPVFNARPKLPGQQLTVVPWHQDSGYFGEGSQRSQILTVWIPLVPVDEHSGCLQVIPGTHTLDLRKHTIEDREGQFLEADMTGLDESEAVTCRMQPGDALIFGNLLMHRSLPSTLPTIRWSIDLRYVRDGDPIGAIRWHDPAFKWVIRSSTQPVTPYEQWMADVEHWPW